MINSADPLVPKKAIVINLNDADEVALAIAVRDNLPALLIGETGTGKTSIVRHLAHLRKQPYVRVNMTGFTTPDDLIGSKSIKGNSTYFEYGIITDAMRRGAILVLDEINATTPDCLFILHGLLDEDRRITLPNGETISPHPDFRVFATCNPDYEGTRSMNKAFLDRFPIILQINHLPVEEEQQLLIDRTGIAADIAKDLVMMATMARTEYMNNKLTMFVSTRTLLHTASLIQHGLDFKTAYQLTVMRKTNNIEEQKVVLDFYLAVRREGGKKSEDGYDIIKVKELKELKSKARDNTTILKEKETIEGQLTEQKKTTTILIAAMHDIKSATIADGSVNPIKLQDLFTKHKISL